MPGARADDTESGCLVSGSEPTLVVRSRRWQASNVGEGDGDGSGVSADHRRMMPMLLRRQLVGRRLRARSTSKAMMAMASGGACVTRMRRAPKTPITSAPTTPQTTRCSTSWTGSERRRSLSNHSTATSTARRKTPTSRPVPPPAGPQVPPERTAGEARIGRRPDGSVVVDALYERVRGELVELFRGESSRRFARQM